MLIKLNSSLLLRELSSIAGVDLIFDLSIDSFNHRCTIPAGSYRKKNNEFSFIKEHGFLSTGKCCFYIEIISVSKGSSILPLMIRLWDEEVFDGKEFLVMKNIAIVRSAFFNMRTPSTSLLSKVIQPIVSSDIYLPLIPNLTKNEYDTLSYYHLHIINQNTLIEAFRYLYYECFDLVDIQQFAWINDNPNFVKRNHQYTCLTDFNIEPSDIFMNISNIEDIEAMLILKRIPYDSFDISINLTNNQVNVNRAQSSSGPFFPFKDDLICNNVSYILNEFIMMFFYVDEVLNTSTNTCSVIYIDKETNIIIESINILRTNDEVVTITFYFGNNIYSRNYDLILLSIMSPLIGD